MILKRLSFALVAVSFSIPVVACLNAASEKVVGDSNALSDEDKAACAFGFTEATAVANPGAPKQPKPTLNAAVDPTITAYVGKGKLADGRPLSFGDINNDGKADLVVVSGTGKLTTFLGKGDGHFSAGVDTLVSAPNSETERELSVVGVGDFDGDHFQDVAVVQATNAKKAGLAYIAGHYAIAYGKADGSFDLVAQDGSLVEGEKSKKAKWHAAADLNGDGLADFVGGGTMGERVLFGDASRKLVKGDTGVDTSEARVITFVTPKGTKPASLVIATGLSTNAVTFTNDAAHTPIVVSSPTALPTSKLVPTDLDNDESPEIAVFATGAGSLTINPLGAGAAAPKVFKNFPGSPIVGVDFALDLAKDGKRQLLFSTEGVGTDPAKLYAACGYSAKTTEIVAAPLAIDFDVTTVFATPDLNGDQKPDLVTYTAGALRVFLGSAPPATPPQLLSFTADVLVPTIDAGPIDTDAGPMDLDAGPPVVIADAGPMDLDAGPPVVIADAGPPVVIADAGPPVVIADAGPPVVHPPVHPRDAGTNPPTTGDDDDDDDVATPKPTTPKKPATKSTDGSGVTVTVTRKDPPPADDGGCSTTPGQKAPSGGLALMGAVAAVVLGARRRRD